MSSRRSPPRPSASLARSQSRGLTAMQGRRCYATPNKQLLALQCPLPRRAVTTVPAPREAIISPQALAPRRIHSEPAHPSWRTFPDSSLAHRASIVCEQVPWRVAEEALRASPSGGVLHLPSLLHYPSSAPLMPLVLSERIDDQSVDRLQTLGLLPHMARLCAVARHPVEPKSALFFGWPELGTFADVNATGPWFARHHGSRTLLTVLHGVAVGLCALHGAGEAHGAVTPAAVGIRHDGGAWLRPCGSLHVRPASGSATLGEKALARDADLRGLGRLLHELGSAGASAPPAVSVALLELAPKCEALELTMHEVASKLADVLRMSVLDSSAAPAVADLPPATQRWSRLRVLLTAASAFTESAAKQALCLICLEEVSTLRGLACPEGHLICSACLQRYICSLAGSARLRSSNGALDCLGAHLQPFSFCRNMVEPLLFGDALRLYLETMETTETPGEGEVQCTPESIQPELHEALNLSCPSCGVFCDPDPNGCIAMKCSSCDVAFCWLCFQPCGRVAHPHCREVHGGYFPPRTVVNQWHRRSDGARSTGCCSARLGSARRRSSRWWWRWAALWSQELFRPAPQVRPVCGGGWRSRVGGNGGDQGGDQGGGCALRVQAKGGLAGGGLAPLCAESRRQRDSAVALPDRGAVSGRHARSCTARASGAVWADRRASSAPRQHAGADRPGQRPKHGGAHGRGARRAHCSRRNAS